MTTPKQKLIQEKVLKEYFEERYLKGTCFDSLEDLQNDKTLVQVNAPRVLIACELIGAWRGLNDEKIKSIAISKCRKEFEQIVDELKIIIKDENKPIAWVFRDLEELIEKMKERI